MNQNLSRQADSDWDEFIKSVRTCEELDLSKTEREWFSERFLSKNLSAFEGGVTVEQGIQKVRPNDPSAMTNADKHFTKIYKKFKDNKKLVLPRNKNLALLGFLEQEFNTWQQSRQAELKLTRVSRSQQMAEALCLLDYGEQEKIFKKRWKSGDRAQAFLWKWRRMKIRCCKSGL